MKRLGFTGTRRGLTDLQACMVEGLLGYMIGPGGVFHHGSCQGADVEVARLVRRSFRPDAEVRIICHPGPDGDPHREESGVDDETRPGKNHFARNRDIVNETDELLACPCDMTEQSRGGTWMTINFARKVGKKVTIVYPDGTLGV